MICYICRDRGLVPFTIKQNEYNYEYYAKCRCQAGRSIVGAGFADLGAVFDESEIMAIKKKNEEYEKGKGINYELSI